MTRTSSRGLANSRSRYAALRSCSIALLSSATRRYDFDRRWRDVRTHTLHDRVVYKTREVGDFVLNDAVPKPDGGQYR
jgi:hypothetical protein